MARILADRDILQLVGKCLISGEKDCVKGNTYELRLGRKARFRNSGEQVELTDGEYLEVGAGETVDLTSEEVIDFRSATVDEVFPDKALWGLLTSRTTLMREGISFAPTKIDSGFFGTLDWVFKNHDFRPVLLPYRERLVNLVIFQLDSGEKPDFEYGQRASDHYQGSSGLQVSARQLPAQIPDRLVKKQTKRPEDAARRIRDYGPPLSWVGTELESLTKQFQDLGTKVDNFMPKIESAIGERFNRAYAFVLGVAGLLGAVITILQKFESQWPPYLLGGLAAICLFIAVFTKPRKPQS